MPTTTIRALDAVATPATGDKLPTDQAADNVTRYITAGQILGLLATISQAEAEAGVATTRRIWTAERVKQAIEALRPAVTRSTADVTTSETTTSTSYADLATVGPAVTLTPGRTTDQFIAISAQMSNSGAAANRASVAIAGAAAADVDALMTRDTSEIVSARQILATSVASGATHTMKYKTGAGTLTALNRRISAFTLS